MKRALLVSPTEQAQDAAERLRQLYDWTDLRDADLVVALGGDGFMLQTLLLSAHARGLGTCAQGALAFWAGPVRAEFEVPVQYRLVCGVSLGYASDHLVNAFDPGRPSVDEVLLAPMERC